MQRYKKTPNNGNLPKYCNTYIYILSMEATYSMFYFMPQK